MAPPVVERGLHGRDHRKGIRGARQVFGNHDKAAITTVNDLRTWFLIFAFVSIGLEFSLRGLREAGWRPVAVFASATVVNIVVALGLAAILFANFDLG